MKVEEIIQENKELHLKCSRLIDTVHNLEKKVNKLEKENEYLRRQVSTLKRAVEIALTIDDYEEQRKQLRRLLGGPE